MDRLDDQYLIPQIGYCAYCGLPLKNCICMDEDIFWEKDPRWDLIEIDEEDED